MCRMGPKAESYASHFFFFFLQAVRTIDRKIFLFHYSLNSNTSPQVEQEQVYCHTQILQSPGEGNGIPLQYSSLENPMDGGAWQAAVHGVAQSRTRPSDFTFTFPFIHWRRKWQPTPVFLPGEPQERGILAGCRLWGRTESDTTEATQQQIHW